MERFLPSEGRSVTVVSDSIKRASDSLAFVAEVNFNQPQRGHPVRVSGRDARH